MGEHSCCGFSFWLYLLIVVFLVLFAGLMSGLTLGLMSLGLVDLEVLLKAGSVQDQKYAGVWGTCVLVKQYPSQPFSGTMHTKILPVVKNQHLLLCTLLLGNALAMEAGKGGELSHDETTIITGALELAQKTAKDAMTPIASTFCIDVNTSLDMKTVHLIMSENHSRIPVYMGSPTNIVGLVLAKNLLAIRPEDNLPLRQYCTIRKMPRVEENMPLYDILNEFQKGHSHMAAVVRYSKDKPKATTKKKLGMGLAENSRKGKVGPGTTTAVALDVAEDVSSDAGGNVILLQKNLGPIFKAEDIEPRQYSSRRGKRRERMSQDDVLDIREESLNLPDDEEVVGIITMEDVIEELLQEEILDETDEYVDIHERIKINMIQQGERPPTVQPSRAVSLPSKMLLPKAVVSPLSSSQRMPLLNSAASGAIRTTIPTSQFQASKSVRSVGISEKIPQPQPNIRLHSLESQAQGAAAIS